MAAPALSNVHTQGAVTNVAGQALVPVLVSAREKILDRHAYDHASASALDDADTTDDRHAVPAAA